MIFCIINGWGSQSESKRNMGTWSGPPWSRACWWPRDGQPSAEPVVSCERGACRDTPMDNLPLSPGFRGPGVGGRRQRPGSQGWRVTGAIVPAHELWGLRRQSNSECCSCLPLSLLPFPPSPFPPSLTPPFSLPGWAHCCFIFLPLFCSVITGMAEACSSCNSPHLLLSLSEL